MQDKDGSIALIKACEDGYVETARVLLDHGANVDQQNNVSIAEHDMLWPIHMPS